MKALLTAATLILTLLFAGCRKDYQAVPSLVGDYDWVWTDENGTITDFSESSDRYGFRILKKGKVHFYKNGKRESKGGVTSVEETLYGEVFTISSDNKHFRLQRVDGEWCMDGFPFNIGHNFFRK